MMATPTRAGIDSTHRAKPSDLSRDEMPRSFQDVHARVRALRPHSRRWYAAKACRKSLAAA